MSIFSQYNVVLSLINPFQRGNYHRNVHINYNVRDNKEESILCQIQHYQILALSILHIRRLIECYDLHIGCVTNVDNVNTVRISQ